MQKGIVIRLYPNNEQKELLNKMFGCVRKVYNYFLDYATTKKVYNYNRRYIRGILWLFSNKKNGKRKKQ